MSMFSRKRQGFSLHLGVYLVTVAFLWAVWYFTGKGDKWPLWPMLGWGFLLALRFVQLVTVRAK